MISNRVISFSRAFTFLITAMVTFAMWEAWNFATFQAKLFPLAVGIPTLLLLALQIGADLSGWKSQSDKRIMDLGFDEDAEAAGISIPSAIAWFTAFLFVTYSFGYRIMILTVVPLFIWRVSRLKWYINLVVVAALWVLTVILLNEYLRLEIPRARYIQLLGSLSAPRG